MSLLVNKLYSKNLVILDCFNSTWFCITKHLSSQKKPRLINIKNNNLIKIKLWLEQFTLLSIIINIPV